MNLIRIDARVLRLLGPERNLACMLAAANIALAAGQFAEPVVIGRVVDTLARAQSADTPPVLSQLISLLLIWVCFGMFNILCGILVALYADRLAHRRRHAVLTGYFEHVLELPLAFHGDVHSGRLMKVMLQGTDSLWSLWIAFFRDHLAAFVSFLVKFGRQAPTLIGSPAFPRTIPS
jgi:ATP-binding cassette, subfamily B, beta-glucan exporter